jgi:aldose 1-epimerase
VGAPVVLYAGDAVLTIEPEAGARFGSLQVHNEELLATEGDGPIDWGCYPMAPFAGRIRQGRFRFRGRTYQLQRNLWPNAIHGTVFDRPWSVVTSETNRAVFEIDLGRRWPFAGRVKHTVSLAADRLEATLELEADEPMPAWLGWHPWFRRTLSSAASVRLENHAERMYERGPDGLPTGSLVEPTTGPWDDAFTELNGPARLKWPGLLSLELESTAAVRVVYDERPHAVCVEPQTAPPNAIELAERASTEPPTAGPGRPMAVQMGWRWTSPTDSDDALPNMSRLVTPTQIRRDLELRG